MSHDLRGFQGTKRYVPRRLLGAGGMGVVYEVDDRTTGGRVALKMMLDDDAGRLLRFKQEFRVMAELHHPNLVRLFDLGQHEGQWFFTMELVHGQDLVEVLRLEDAAGMAFADAMTVEARSRTIRSHGALGRCAAPGFARGRRGANAVDAGARGANGS
jgi:serine/threonine protein kinase